MKEKVPSGESYLVQINPDPETNTKTVYLSNLFYKNQNPFLAKFYQLNCEFEITRNDKQIYILEGYGQEILDHYSQYYKTDFYKYNIKIIEYSSAYSNKMCMLYIAGYEAETEFEREIVVAENQKQPIIFEDNFEKIRLLYPHADAEKDLAIIINVIDKALYTINIYVINNIAKEESISSNQIFFLAGNDIVGICEHKKLCPIVVEVIYNSPILIQNPMIEITIRQTTNTPTYIKNGIVKTDFTAGDRYYYLYTDLYKNEAGEITVNFLRESGGIYGKIVRKDQTTKDEEAN